MPEWYCYHLISYLAYEEGINLTWAIETIGLTKIFKPSKSLPWGRHSEDGVIALDGVNLQVAPGEIFGIMGPNGAGKTTLIKVLSTLILPTSGRAFIHGYDLLSQPERVKSLIGLVSGDDRSFYWRLSCRENLLFFATLYDLSPSQARSRIAGLSRLLDLEDFLDRRYGYCSSGMKQRLALARSLIHGPRVLLMDEPTKSLDPGAAKNLRHYIQELVQDGQYTVVLVTHRWEEAQKLCQRVGLMHRGRIQVYPTAQLNPDLLLSFMEEKKDELI